MIFSQVKGNILFLTTIENDSPFYKLSGDYTKVERRSQRKPKTQIDDDDGPEEEEEDHHTTKMREMEAAFAAAHAPPRLTALRALKPVLTRVSPPRVPSSSSSSRSSIGSFEGDEFDKYAHNEMEMYPYDTGAVNGGGTRKKRTKRRS